MSRKPTTITAQPGTPFIDVTREFDATPAQLWRASTDPDLIAQWLGPRGVEMHVEQYDVRPGGRYRYLHRDADGTEYAFRGVFHAATENERIIQTFEYEGWPDDVCLETHRFEDLDGSTRLHTHSVFPSIQARDTAIESGMEDGINDSMDRLAEVLQAGPPSQQAQVIVDISMSLDGYVAGADVDAENGLGVGGEALHDWAIGKKSERDAEILEQTVARTGAVLMGRTTFDIVDGPNGWGDDVGYGAAHQPPTPPPVFVVTHKEPDHVRLADRFRFVTDGLASAIEQARTVAGDKDIVVMGGGAVAAECLRAGLADVLSLHLAPVVLGAGTPLFQDLDITQFELTDAITTPAAQHLTYRVRKGADHD
ncbi:SRPBCC domain-containing protein [Kribbella sp. NBC_01245]|uniref:SRPBCC domain-containing protein n=1 Tax=Kribbella sp. NBC_01245 TaxID=2903578 RepID=UPI002E28E1B5|nr:SRPBCC domain-containing protein [Kribbella sp. NBC_01245]